MGRRYSVDGGDTNTDNTTIIGLTSVATTRPMIYDLNFGSKAAPADNACGYELQRYTVAGTSTAVTPQALNPGDPAALASAGKAHTVEPTYTAAAILLRLTGNMRASVRWVAAPQGELMLPATAANGVGVQADTPSTAFSVDFCIHYEE